MPLVLSQCAQQVVVRHAVQPRGRVAGNAVWQPRRQGCQERALYGIFHRFEVGKPHTADQYRHQPAVLVPEVMFHQTRAHILAPAISRISSDAPGAWTAGQALTSFTASS